MKLFDSLTTIEEGQHLLDKKIDRILFIISVASFLAATFCFVLVSEMG